MKETPCIVGKTLEKRIYFLTYDFLSLVFVSMKKTNTKKTASAKKSPGLSKAPVVKKVVAPKKTMPVAVSKKTVKKVIGSAPKKSTPVVPQKTIAVRKPKTIKKIAAPQKIVTKPIFSKHDIEKEDIQLLGVVHFILNLSGLGLLFVLLYFLVKAKKISQKEKQAIYHIINFDFSFIIYGTLISFYLLSFIGILFAPIFFVFWIILSVL